MTPPPSPSTTDPAAPPSHPSPSPAPPALSPEACTEWIQTRSSWPRLLPPSLYAQITPHIKFANKKRTSHFDDGEPRWCRAWTKVVKAISVEEWHRLTRVHARDLDRRDELSPQLLRSPWKLVYSSERTEFLDTDDRIEARWRECLALATLWAQYTSFEFQHGVPTMAALFARLESFGEDETPSYAEREERARDWVEVD
ncbi:hypothetical protein JCM6882_008772 [Rhodosporidiobolus microsporus]